jgi:hypothetical protein
MYRQKFPGGQEAPTSIRLGEVGESVDIEPLASEICRRYQIEFPDEQGRYGAAGQAWCLHDNSYLLYWAAETANGYDVMQSQISWLAVVLESRDFPLERLARDLDIGADVIRERVAGDAGDRLSAVLADAATFVRSRSTFLDQSVA